MICAPQLAWHFLVRRTELEDPRRQAFHRPLPGEISAGQIRIQESYFLGTQFVISNKYIVQLAKFN
jgi:hypothetical protein